MFWRRRPYSRSDALAAAERARGRGRTRTAVRHYLEVLAHEPNDLAIHARVAPLLAKLGRVGEARASFERAAEGFLAQGLAAKAVAVWTVAAQRFPEHVAYWERIAQEQTIRGHRADAVATLLDGRAMLRRRRQRPQAILVLRQVLALHPRHVEATLDLADLLRAEGIRNEALRLLGELASVVRGPVLRRLRFAEFRLQPTLRGALRWLFAR